MKRFVLAAAASAAAIVSATPAAAVTYVRNLGTITVPPDLNPTVDPIQASAGSVDAYYNFTLGAAFTVTGAIFASTNPNAVTFSSAGLYQLASPAAFPTSGSTGAPTGLLRSFTPSQSSDAFGNQIGIAPIVLQAGSYSIYVAGNAAQARTITSAFSFTSPVPEPATWGLMLLGFGMVGVGLRSRRQARVNFA